jgi:DNA-binding NarL/FixJ family response regulator
MKTMTIRLLIADPEYFVQEGLRSILAGHPEFVILGEATSDFGMHSMIPQYHPDVVILNGEFVGKEVSKFLSRISKAETLPRLVFLLDPKEKDLAWELFSANQLGLISIYEEPEWLIEGIQAVIAGQSMISPSIFIGLRETLRLSGQKKSYAPLSAREMQVMDYLLEDLTNREIAERLEIAERMVEFHVKNIGRKLGVKSRVGIVMQTKNR